MPTDSPNLGLKYYDTTTDSHNKFLTFRSDMAGPLTSNMSKIDAWAGNTNSKIQKLEDSVSGVVLNAQFKSTGYYEAVSPLISTYKIGQAVIVKPDTTTDGSTMLKVNALDVKSLMKYSATGELINLDAKDLKINHEYLFRYEGSAWVWQTATSGDQINIVGISDNILVVSADGSIVDSGIKAEQINTNKDTIGNKESLKTTEKTNLVGAINEVVDSVGSEVLTTISQTVKGAINEVDSKAAKDIAYDPLGTELVATNVGDAINEIESKRLILSEDIGNKTNLQTDDKTNLVAAVNEVKSQFNEIANQPCAKLALSAKQLIPNNIITKVAMATLIFDNNDMLDTINNRITIPKSGKYLITGTISYVIGGAVGQKEAFLYKNGALYTSGGFVSAKVEGIFAMTFSYIESFVTGDYIELFTRQQSGIDINVTGTGNGSRTHMAILRIGD